MPQAIPTGEEPGKVTIADASAMAKTMSCVSLPLTHRIMILPATVMGPLVYRFM